MAGEQMSTIKHENLNPLLGVCITSPNVAILMLAGHKGCLRDVLQNEQIKINVDYLHSFVVDITHVSDACFLIIYHVWLGGVVVSALGMRTRRARFESRVAPLFHWIATLDKLFTHIASPVSQLQETWVQKGVFGA